MSDHTKLLIAVLIENSIMVICFTALAITFNTWWIVLFSLLFLSSFETKKIKKEEPDGQ